MDNPLSSDPEQRRQPAADMDAGPKTSITLNPLYNIDSPFEPGRLELAGTEGEDRLRGTADDDLLDGGDGADRLNGGNGNDELFGGAGGDRLNGGRGNDILVGGIGDDRLHGGGDADLLLGGDGDDRLGGGAGDDSLDGDAGNDRLNGGDGDDEMFGGAGDDRLNGGDGEDSLDGGEGDDRLNGGDGDDVLDAGDGENRLNGGSGNDILVAGLGNDRLNGGAGNDRLDGGMGDDRLVGGRGDDTIVGGGGDDIMRGDGGRDARGADVFIIGAGGGNDRIVDFSQDDGDRIDVSGLGISDFAELVIDAGRNKATIDFSDAGGGSLTLNRFKGDLEADDFIFAANQPAPEPEPEPEPEAEPEPDNEPVPEAATAPEPDATAEPAPEPAAAGEKGDYDITIAFNGSWTAELQGAFNDAVARLESVIWGDVADVYVPINGVNTLVDDLYIEANLYTIDGTGGILGQAGPRYVRTDDYIPVSGEMTFDVADAQWLDDNGLWDDVVLHEMAHVLGFGTLWSYQGLLSGAGTANPTYTGQAAMEAFGEMTGGGAAPIAVEQDGGGGTALSHWDEQTFGNELMTGYINYGDNAFSAMTAASFADLGYDLAPESNWLTDDYAMVA